MAEEDHIDLVGDDPRPPRPPVERDARGRILKGSTGNPGGRIKDRIAPLARERGPEALAVLVQLMTDEKAAPKERIAAAEAVLSRGYGKPVQMTAEVDTEGNDARRGTDPNPALLMALGQLAKRLEESRRGGELIDVTPIEGPVDRSLIDLARRLAYMAHRGRQLLEVQNPSEEIHSEPKDVPARVEPDSLG